MFDVDEVIALVAPVAQRANTATVKAISEITAQVGKDKLKGYILDLRNNPGGLLDQAISVSDAFLEKGEIVSTRGRRPDSVQRFNARPGDITNGKPHPDPYLKGASKLGFSPSNFVVVEDVPAGVRSGKAAGAKIIATRA